MNNDNNELANFNEIFDDHFDINVSANDTEILPVIGMQCMVSCTHLRYTQDFISGLMQDCSNSSALATELLQSCAKPPTRCRAYVAS